jgi:hypothetical protein
MESATRKKKERKHVQSEEQTKNRKKFKIKERTKSGMMR